MSPVDRPAAPCSRARRTCARIRASSSFVGSRSSSPITRERMALWPIKLTAFNAGRAAVKAARYASKSAKRSEKPGKRLALLGGCAPPETSGARLKPQFPITTLVTPCSNLNSSFGLFRRAASSCACTSTKPGASARPCAAISRLPLGARPMNAMRSPSMWTSATRGALPLPSNSNASRILRSKAMYEHLFGGRAGFQVSSVAAWRERVVLPALDHGTFTGARRLLRIARMRPLIIAARTIGRQDPAHALIHRRDDAAELPLEGAQSTFRGAGGFVARGASQRGVGALGAFTRADWIAVLPVGMQQACVVISDAITAAHGGLFDTRTARGARRA